MNPLANSQKINRSPPHLHLNLRADSDPRRVSFNPTEEESESYSASLLLGSQGYDIKSRKAASITGFGDHFLCQAGYNSEEAASPLNDQTQKERDCLTFEKMVSHVESVLDEDLDVLERFPSNVLHLDPKIELHTKADKLSLAYRRLLDQMINGVPA